MIDQQQFHEKRHQDIRLGASNWSEILFPLNRHPPPKTDFLALKLSDNYFSGVSLCHRGGRIQKINAWYLNTHMVYL